MRDLEGPEGEIPANQGRTLCWKFRRCLVAVVGEDILDVGKGGAMIDCVVQLVADVAEVVIDAVAASHRGSCRCRVDSTRTPTLGLKFFSVGFFQIGPIWATQVEGLFVGEQLDTSPVAIFV